MPKGLKAADAASFQEKRRKRALEAAQRDRSKRRELAIKLARAHHEEMAQVGDGVRWRWLLGVNLRLLGLGWLDEALAPVPQSAMRGTDSDTASDAPMSTPGLPSTTAVVPSECCGPLPALAGPSSSTPRRWQLLLRFYHVILPNVFPAARRPERTYARVLVPPNDAPGMDDERPGGPGGPMAGDGAAGGTAVPCGQRRRVDGRTQQDRGCHSEVQVSCKSHGESRERNYKPTIASPATEPSQHGLP